MKVYELINVLDTMRLSDPGVFEHREDEHKRKPWESTPPDFKQSVDGVVFRNGECVLISSKLSKKNDDNS